MMLSYLPGLLLSPKSTWQAIREDSISVSEVFSQYVVILALIPPVAGFVGTTQVGWQLGFGDPIKLTMGSALVIAVLFYFAILAAVGVVGKAIYWMANTYGAEPSLADCIVLAAGTSTPLLLVGVLMFYPMLLLIFLVGLLALAMAVYLLYVGVPIMMGIPEDRGFLFSSSVVTFGLVAFVAMLAITVILWGLGIAPEYTN
jgi:hypothetical protein